MDWVETAGRTLAEAKDAALDQLGVDETDAEFVVVSEPKVGLFGRTRGEARVRARVRPTQPRPKRGRERRTSSGRSRSGSGRDAGGRRPTTAAAGAKDGPGDRAPRQGSGPSDQDAGERAEDDGAAGGAGTRSGNRRRRGGRGRGGNGPAGGGPAAESAGSDAPDAAPAPSARDAAGPAPSPIGNGTGSGTDGAAARTRSASRAEQTDTTDKENPVVEMSLEQQGEAARQFVADLVQTLGLTASVDAHPADEETVAVAVEGEGVATLIGPGGSTLQALQELTRTYVQKLTGGQSDRILVDVAGYRARRVAALQRFTEGVAQEVVASGEARALEPMSAADRKVVHDAVNGIDGVGTRSEGEDPRRYIVIVPDASEGEG